MSSQTIEVEAGSLEEAEQKLQLQVPNGFAVLSRQILSDGKPKSLQASAETTQAAWEKVQSQVPPGAIIQSKRELIPPGRQVLNAQAFDEQEAKSQAVKQLRETSTIKSIQITVPPRKGLLGLGKSPGSYEIEIIQQAVVEVTYTSPAKIRAIFDHAIIIEAEQLLGVEGLKGLEHLKGEMQVDAFLRKIATGSAEQFNLLPESTLSGLVESSNLGMPSKGDISGGLAARLLEINCRSSRVWTGLFNTSYGSPYSVQTIFNKHPIEALDLLVWYMYTPEAVANNRIRANVQLWFLGLAERHYPECGPTLQERIIAELKDMIKNWKGQYSYVIPECCKLLVATGRKDVLSVVADGIRRSDAEYTQTLRMIANDDESSHSIDPNDALQEWEKFKQSVTEAMGG